MSNSSPTYRSAVQHLLLVCCLLLMLPATAYAGDETTHNTQRVTVKLTLTKLPAEFAPISINWLSASDAGEVGICHMHATQWVEITLEAGNDCLHSHSGCQVVSPADIGWVNELQIPNCAEVGTSARSNFQTGLAKATAVIEGRLMVRPL